MSRYFVIVAIAIVSIVIIAIVIVTIVAIVIVTIVIVTSQEGERGLSRHQLAGLLLRTSPT